MSDDEKIVCFGALKTFYKDIEEIFVKKDSEERQNQLPMKKLTKS